MNHSIQKSINSLLAVFFIFSIHSCNTKQKSENKVENEKIVHSSTLNGFEFIRDFEKNKIKFNKDSYELYDYSADGGELIVYHLNEKAYSVFDFWLYGETGKLNYTYWLDKTHRFLFARKRDFIYDKPYYEQGFKVDTIIHYLSFEKPVSKLYDKNKIEIISTNEMESTKYELESFFDDLTSEIEISN